MRRGIPRVFSEFYINVLEQNGEGGGLDTQRPHALICSQVALPVLFISSDIFCEGISRITL